MRYVTRIELDNWGPFRGKHTIELEPTVYAVVAQHENDPERSNWVGKTWFLNSMLFALTGLKPDSCKSEDGWITDGEDTGGVQLWCDDGTHIERNRKRGRSTQLVVTLAGGKPQKQAVAQDNLYIAMGMDADDLLATSFIRQKATSRLITEDPAVRTKAIGGWVELGPLQLAEAWLRKQLNELLKQERGLELGDEPAGILGMLKTKLVEANAGLKEVTDDRDAAQRDLVQLTTWHRHQDDATEFEEVQARGKVVRADDDAYQAPDMDATREAQAVAAKAKGDALDREAELKELVHGEWDGKCPLTCQGCPAEVEVRAVGASMEMELSEAELVLDEAAGKADTAQTALDDALRGSHDSVARAAELVTLRSKAEQLLDGKEYIAEHGPPPTADESVEQLQDLNTEVSTWTQSVADLTAAIAAHAAYAAKAEQLAERRATFEGTIRTHQEALAVVGRLGAQREVAEGALARIERGANTLLTDSGIDLQVAVRWAREGRGLATHCESCGSAFPTSQRVKTCDICGATRGPKLVEKLDIRPSNYSGAADDIAGLAFQLAASSWLRVKRSASWASACIDEPFASLDKANSRALSTHLHTLIRGNYAFDQGFLVAHDAQAMESLPARIQIYGGAEGAVIEVQ